ncbi:MAG: cytochrome c [Marinifilaceae bacterium]
MKAIQIIAILGITLIAYAFITPNRIQQKEPAPWEVPTKYKNMENPHVDDAACTKMGKMLYSRHCRSCHGNTGLGDGPKAARLKTFPGDFSSTEFQKQTDGEIYYKSIIGRDEMPNYEKKIPKDKDRWAVVNYIRTLKK